MFLALCIAIADEVKALVSLTQHSKEEIKIMIEMLQYGTKENYHAMEASVKLTEDTVGRGAWESRSFT